MYINRLELSHGAGPPQSNSDNARKSEWMAEMCCLSAPGFDKAKIIMRSMETEHSQKVGDQALGAEDKEERRRE